MVATPRNVLGFEPVGQGLIVFPTSQLEWEFAQNLRTAYSPVVGASYAYDMLGSSAAPKDVSVERVRFFAIEDTADELDDWVDDTSARLYLAGKGKLWTEGADGSRRWAWARLTQKPIVKVTIDNWTHLPIILEFERYSDWYAAEPTVHTATVTTSTYEFQVDNAGNARIEAVRISLEANAASGFNDPVLTNLGNGHQFSIDRTAANGEILVVDAGAYTVQRSLDGGDTWLSAYGLIEMSAQQVAFMRLQPGANLMRLDNTGTTNLDLSITFDAAYE